MPSRLKISQENVPLKSTVPLPLISDVDTPTLCISTASNDQCLFHGGLEKTNSLRDQDDDINLVHSFQIMKGFSLSTDISDIENNVCIDSEHPAQTVSFLIHFEK